MICNLFLTTGNGTVPRIELDSHFPRTQKEYVSSMIKKIEYKNFFLNLFYFTKHLGISRMTTPARSACTRST